MKKYILKVFSLVLAVVMGMSSFGAAFAAEEIPEGYTPIYTAEDLNNIRNNLSGKYILMNHIDLSEVPDWKSVASQDTSFSGELNGNGYSVIGLNSSESLLGYTENAVIRNLGIADCYISQIDSPKMVNLAGAFAEHALNTEFINCFASGKIIPATIVGWSMAFSNCSAGGIVGSSVGSVFTNCYNKADVCFTFDKTTESWIGGLVGSAIDTKFVYCYNSGSVYYEYIDGHTEEIKNEKVNLGGLTGRINENTLFDSCYFADSSDAAVGMKALTPDGTKKLSVSQMVLQESYEDFDFENDWKILNGSSPKLRTEKSFIVQKLDINYKQSVSAIQYGSVQIVEWKTTDENIAVINDEGLIYGTGTGDAVITVSTSDGFTEDISVRVSYTFWQKIIVYLFFGWLWY